MQKDNSRASYRLIQLLVVVVGVVLIALIDRTYCTDITEESDRDLTLAATDMQQDLSVMLNHLTLVATDLSTFLLTHADPADKQAFTAFSANLREHYPAIDSLVYVGPDRVVRAIYPLVGNENAIGLDLSKRHAAEYIDQAIRERRLIVDPPHVLSNGRLAVVARSPMFRGNSFAGIAQAILYVPDIVENRFEERGNEYEIQLRDENGKLFWGSEQLRGASQNRNVVVGSGMWTLTIASVKPPVINNTIRAGIWGVGGLMLLMALVGVHSSYRFRQTLKAKIEQATSALRVRNEELEQEMRQRQEAEAQVRRSEQSLREAQHIAHMGNWEWDIATGRIRWSDELCEIFAFIPQEFEPTYEAFLMKVHPQDRDAVERAVTEALEYGRPYETEHRILLPDGKISYIRESGIVQRDSEGKPQRMAGTAQDITLHKLSMLALEESESKYRAVLENASDGILISNLEGNILEVNRRIQNLLGYSREQLINMHVGQIHPTEDVDKLRIAFTSIREHGFSLFEHLLLHENGSTIPVEVAGTLVSFGSQQVALGIFRDIRERKRIEAELQQYRHHLEQLVEQRTAELVAINSELESFSYSVSHDLRAPLRAIKGFSRALNEDCRADLDSSCRDYLMRIQSASEHMGCLIDDLLHLSQTVSSEMRLKNVLLSAITHELIAELRVAAPERQVQCIVADGVSALADPTLLRSLMQNLLSNAWKFTRTRAEAVIEFGAISEGGRRTYFVRDNGIGFEMVHANDLFSPFYRLHPPADFEGNGIGLATTQRIVHRHGGRVWADSEPGCGATFFFTLGPEDE